MDRELADLHRGARRERERLIPDPEPGKTLPQQIEGDHAYRDEPPRHDPANGFQCVICRRRLPDRGRALACCPDVEI